MGLKSSNKTLAIIGIVVGVLAMLLTLINAVAGAVLGATNPGLYENIINSL